MAQSIIVHALIEKRSEISGIIADLEEPTRQSRADLAHIDATLRLFDPDVKNGAIRAKQPPKERAGPFANGEMSRRIRDALRAATEPIAAESIVRSAMTDKGWTPMTSRCGLHWPGPSSGHCTA